MPRSHFRTKSVKKERNIHDGERSQDDPAAQREDRPLAALVALLIALAVAGCGGSATALRSSSSGSGSGGKLDVVGYSTPESVYQESLEPAFEKTSEGSGVSFSNSFGASGDQSRAVAAGQPASVVHFSQAGDMERLVEEGEVVAKDWDKQPYSGHRPGLGRRDHRPQGQPGGHQVPRRPARPRTSTSSPRTRSAPARRAGTSWPSTAPQLNEGKSPDQALEGVKTLLEKTVAQPGSARDALAAFTQGQGDVLLSYENEAIKAVKEGEDVEYVVPPSTILIETPIAVTKEASEPAAEDFLKFIWSDDGQEIWAENGYRPVNPKLVDPKQFPTPTDLFKISQFGGWGKVNDDFFDEETGSVAKIEGELGVSTSG